jgi:peptide-methionine (S)-S-oxide reductase
VLADKLSLPNSEQALPGRDAAMPVNNQHFVHGHSIQGPFSSDDSSFEVMYIGMGCFWGAERKFWSIEGVHTTAVGYGGGFTPNPSYEEVCSGRTGHNELVMVVYNPSIVSTNELLKVFFESHNPTQGMQQGNDIGTQYRSGLYFTTEAQRDAALHAKSAFESALNASSPNLGPITTEIEPASAFYYAEEYHQQYLAKNPNGYCGLGGTGVTCAI